MEGIHPGADKDGAIYINQSTDPSGNYSTLVRRIEVLDWGA